MIYVKSRIWNSSKGSKTSSQVQRKETGTYFQNETLNSQVVNKTLKYLVRGEERIIRGCGHIEYKNPCYTNVQEEYNTYICTCKGQYTTQGFYGDTLLNKFPSCVYTGGI